MERFPDGFLWGTAASAFQIEGAAALDISPATFHRELRLARAWLQREMDDGS